MSKEDDKARFQVVLEEIAEVYTRHNIDLTESAIIGRLVAENAEKQKKEILDRVAAWRDKK